MLYLHVIDMTCKILLCTMFNYNIYNQPNKCSVKLDVWMSYFHTKTIEQIVKLPFLKFFLSFCTTLFLHVPSCYSVYMH